MNRFLAHHFAYFSKSLGELSVEKKPFENPLFSAISGLGDNNENISLEKYEIERIISILEVLEPQCSDIGLRISQKKIMRTINYFKNGLTIDHKRTISNICEIIEDELSDIYFLRIPENKSKYYQSEECLFGADVSDKFPSTLFDIDESAKCYSLNRGTACVFHLMRVIEIGLDSVRKSLDVQEPNNKNWGATLKSIATEIESRGTNKNKKWKNDDKQFFEEVYGSLDAIKNAWRNPTLHVAIKYTDDEAYHLFILVRGFMMKLGSRLNENGVPLA